ncbi:MAG: tRNA (adenosine(37)-N6)-threonylcarbamoyltransferase complex ATPase subunit type 1 TsaE [Verrucomicrobia bacterium]|nr:tRNA (adenosine(37)-N6)-threonylcarbamoyltransferase complex ATPase subunit type 1 TsaE [Verrucomicrobiota bacterium]
MPEQIRLSSLEETDAFAQQFASKLKPNDILALTGDLGAGKTTLVKGLAKGMGSIDLIQSPTFVYLNIYQAKLPLYHFDLYRFRSPSDFLSMGFEEYFFKGGVTVIEWPERIENLIPPHAWRIDLTTLSESERVASIRTWGNP